MKCIRELIFSYNTAYGFFQNTVPVITSSGGLVCVWINMV